MDIAAAYADTLISRPDMLAYVGVGETMTWREVDVMTGAMLTALDGVPTDAAIGVLARTRPAMVAAFVRLFMDGRDTIMMHAFQPRLALIVQLREKRIAALVADEADIDTELEAFARDTDMRLIGVNTQAARLVEPGGLWQTGDYLRSAGDGGIMMLTSGTTGAPKHVALRRSTIEAAAIGSMTSMGYSPNGNEKPPHFVTVLAFPLGNISGVYNSVPTAAVGATLCLLEKFSVEGYADLVRRYPQQIIGMPPAGIKMMLDANLPSDLFGGATHCMTGSASLDPDVQEAFERKFGLPVYTSYGATEFGGMIACWSRADHENHWRQKRGAVGRALPGAHIRVVDPASGDPLPPGSLGRLETQVDRIGPDWLSTNDLAVIDEDGFLFIKGRADDVITRGGFKIDPVTVNSALEQHPAVAEAETLGRADARLGQVPVSAVVLYPGQEVTTDDLTAFVRERIVGYAVPVEIRLVDAIPRNPSFKVDRRELAKLLA